MEKSNSASESDDGYGDSEFTDDYSDEYSGNDNDNDEEEETDVEKNPVNLGVVSICGFNDITDTSTSSNTLI